MFAAVTVLLQIGISTPVDVHVYDSASVPSSVLREARLITDVILESASLDLKWHKGDSSAVDATLIVYTPLDVKNACAARRDIAVRITRRAPDGVPRGAIGMARPFVAQGSNVTLFYERALDVAERHGFPVGVVLGHALAHEIGHVLLRDAQHDPRGLMSAVWGANEILRMRTMSLLFNRAHSLRMSGTLRGVGCAGPVVTAALPADGL